MSATKIGPGEYEYKGYSISKDEYESQLWWVSEDDGEHFNCRADFPTKKAAMEFIDRERA